MNIIIEKSSFLTPITKLVAITEKRSTMPILSNMLISFGRENTTIYATDLEISATAYIDYKAEEEKKIVIHGRKLLEILKEMEEGNINLEINNNILKIKQKKTEFVISLQEPEDFPEISEVSAKEEIIINGKKLLEMIDKVSFAISADETRNVLTGMFLKGTDKKITVVGTDGYRMSLYNKEIEGVHDFNGMIIPKKSLIELERMIDDEDEVRLSVDEKHVQFSTERIKLVSRIIEGTFPDYRSVIPENNTNIATIDREVFLKGLKKVSAIIGRSEPVKIMLYKDGIEIDAESDIGSAKEVIEAKYEGADMTMNFNIRFLMDVASHIEGENIIIKSPTTHGAVLFEGMDEKGYKNVVMPIRI